MARPNEYSFEIGMRICDRLRDGERLLAICEEPDMPARSTFFNWKRDNKELLDYYVNTVQDKGLLCLEEIDQTVDDLKAGIYDPSTANVIIQTLKWKAAKYYPKMFGDNSKVDVTVDKMPTIVFRSVSDID